MALSGCQHSGQQAVDPFWGRTTVSRPRHLPAVGVNPCYPQPATVSAGPSNALQATPPPNLLPATASPTPAAPVTITPAPAMPAPAATGALTCLLRRPYPRRLIIAHPLRDTPVWVQLHPAPCGHLRQPLIREHADLARTSVNGRDAQFTGAGHPATTPSPAGSPPPTSPGYSPPGGYRYDGQKSTGPSASGAGQRPQAAPPRGKSRWRHGFGPTQPSYEHRHCTWSQRRPHSGKRQRRLVGHAGLRRSQAIVPARFFNPRSQIADFKSKNAAILRKSGVSARPKGWIYRRREVQSVGNR